MIIEFEGNFMAILVGFKKGMKNRKNNLIGPKIIHDMKIEAQKINLHNKGHFDLFDLHGLFTYRAFIWPFSFFKISLKDAQKL